MTLGKSQLNIAAVDWEKNLSLRLDLIVVLIPDERSLIP